MEEALGQRLRADPTFYNAGLSAVSLRWTWTLELLARMLRADMAPDSFTMNSALSGLVRGDQWRVAVQVMEEMESMRVRADIITFNTLLNVARWHKLEDIVVRAVAEGYIGLHTLPASCSQNKSMGIETADQSSLHC